jgi:hypothetical protein
MARITADHLALIKEDEARWFDQQHSWLVTCDTIEEDLSSIRPDEANIETTKGRKGL